MQFTVEATALNAALKKISPAIQRVTSLPILEYVLCVVKDNVLSIKGTNLRITINISIPCQSTDQLEVVLPFKKLLNITSTLSAPITIICDKKANTIKHGRGKYELGVPVDAKDFPPSKPIKAGFQFLADSNFLENMHLSKSFVSTAETETFFCDVLIRVKENVINLCASDRLHIIHYHQPTDFKGNKSFLFSTDFINAISGFQSGNIVADEKQIMFTSEDESFTAISLLNEIEYPDVLKVVSSLQGEPKNVVFDRKEMLQSINQIMVFDEPFYVAEFNLGKENKIDIKWKSLTTNESVEISLDAEHKTDCQSIGFNAKKLKDCISALAGSESLSLSISTAVKPVCIYGDDENTVVIITPVVIAES